MVRQQVVVSESRQRFQQRPVHRTDSPMSAERQPRGSRTLAFVRIQHARVALYRASGAVCQACPAFRVCTRPLRGIGPPMRTLPPSSRLDGHLSSLNRRTAVESNWSSLFGIIKEQQGNPEVPAARPRYQRGGRVDHTSAKWPQLSTCDPVAGWRSRAFAPATPRAESPSRMIPTVAGWLTSPFRVQSIATFDSPGKRFSKYRLKPLLPVTLYITFGTGSIVKVAAAVEPPLRVTTTAPRRPFVVSLSNQTKGPTVQLSFRAPRNLRRWP